GILAIRFPGRIGWDESGDDARGDLRVGDAREVVQNVVAGQLAAIVERYAFAQVQLDLPRISALLPALGQHRLDLEVVVVARERVVDDPRRQADLRAVIVAIEGDELAYRC